jgi:hypothetical protein
MTQEAKLITLNVFFVIGAAAVTVRRALSPFFNERS